MKKEILLSFIVGSVLFADSTQEILEGFDDSPVKSVQVEKNSADLLDGFDDSTSPSIDASEESQAEPSKVVSGLTGKLTEQATYSYNGATPHDKFTSLKSSLFLDYEYKFENGWRIKTNARAYYDAIYDLREENYSRDELDEQRSEVELFEAYIEGSVTDTIDMKLGRQVVAWGRSDTIRITDVLNPLDNRRPGIVDVEDLRLPTTMLKFDFFFDNWRITPIAVLEQRFSKSPAFGSAFYPSNFAMPKDEEYNDVTYALSVGAEFSGWDVNFYAAKVHNEVGRISMPFSPNSKLLHDKVSMLGSALNVLSGAWLLKAELAHFEGLKFTSTGNKEFSRTDALLGFEYKGIADMLISYDVSLRHFSTYDKRLNSEILTIDKDTYQHAFRITSDFMNDSLTANYLLSLYGKNLDQGGFQRAWIKYELSEGINTNFGVVDYIGGSTFFDSIKDNDMFFVDISYNF